MPLQTSQVFSQREWPGSAPDGETTLDDCGGVSGIQAVNVVMPWANLPGMKGYREAAGNPDGPGAQGWDIPTIARGILGVWPELRGHLTRLNGDSWDAFLRNLDEHRPASVAVDSGKLPKALAFGTTAMHQVTLVRKPNGRIAYANPLAKAYSRWKVVDNIDVFKPAILGYGKQRGGRFSVFALFLPTEEEALRLHPLFSPEVAKAAEERVAATRAALDARTTALRTIAAEAAAAAESPPTP